MSNLKICRKTKTTSEINSLVTEFLQFLGLVIMHLSLEFIHFMLLCPWGVRSSYDVYNQPKRNNFEFQINSYVAEKKKTLKSFKALPWVSFKHSRKPHFKQCSEYCNKQNGIS